MKALFSRVAVVLTLVTSSALSQTQVRTAVFGRTTIQFSSTFTTTVASLGGSLSDLTSSPLSALSVTLPVTTGALNPNTAVGEVEHSSGFTITGGGKVVRLENFIIDTTGAVPVITAVFVLNDTVLGRMPLFNVAYPSGVTLPLTTTAGVLQLAGLKLSLSSAAATTLNGAFNINGVQSGLDVGTGSIYVVFAPLTDGSL